MSNQAKAPTDQELFGVLQRLSVATLDVIRARRLKDENWEVEALAKLDRTWAELEQFRGKGV